MSIVSAELIRNHLANTSPTKIAHVFSKSKRFLSPNPEYHKFHIDAGRLFTGRARANSPRRRQLSVLESDMISLKRQRKHQPPARIRCDQSFPE